MTEYALMLALVIVGGFLGYRFLGGKIAGTGGDSSIAFSGSGSGKGGGGTGTDKGKSTGSGGDATQGGGGGGSGGGGGTKGGGGASGGSSGGAGGALGDARVLGMGSGTIRLLAAIIGGFFLLGIYFVFRNAKKGAGNKG